MTKQVKDRLDYLRGEIEKECISYDEIIELSSYHKEIYELGDVVLAEWAGISEDDWNSHQQTCKWHNCGKMTDNGCQVCDQCQQSPDFDGTDFSNL